jgi:hypothetical protein
MREDWIRESEYGNSPNNLHIVRRGEEVGVTMTYPSVEGERVRHVYVNQESVRGSDGIRMHYDYERDGFVIEQASRFAWPVGDPICDPDWKEVAFIQSWAREETEEEKNKRIFGSEQP